LKSIFPLIKSTFEQIDGIIHGAGIDHSNYLAKKTVAEFEKVFGVKALGAMHLLRVCSNEPIRLIIGFASISGRFGNAAQIDYSAGNSFLNYWTKYAKLLFPDAQSKSINWSGWKDAGMAWNNDFVREHSEDAGIQFISLTEGQQAFLMELDDRSETSEVLIHKGLGSFLQPNLSELNETYFPFIDRVVANSNRPKKAFRLLSIKRDQMLDQHRLHGTPLIPAVAYLEACAEFYSLLTGNNGHFHFENIKFEKALRLFNNKSVEILIESEQLEEDRVQFTVKSLFQPRNAEWIQEVDHCSMIVSQSRELLDSDPKKWLIATEKGDESKSASFLNKFIEKSRANMDLGNLYIESDIYLKKEELYFKDGERGQIYNRCVPSNQLSNSAYPIDKFLLNPCLLDSIFQAGGFYCTLKLNQIYLPWQVEKLAVINPPKEKGKYTVYADRQSQSDDSFCLNIAVCKQNGELCYIAQNAHFHKISN
jgi:hypothetical protein